MLRLPLPLAGLLAACGALAPGCACPPLLESYATPSETLATWQAHLCRDDPGGEYACLAASFQRAMAGFENYHAARAALLRERPVAAWMLEHADLRDHQSATSYSADGRSASVRLEARGETVFIRFEREAWVTLGHADGTSTTMRQTLPMDELLGSQAGRQWLLIEKPALSRDQLAAVRLVHVDSRWQIADLAGLADAARSRGVP